MRAIEASLRYTIGVRHPQRQLRLKHLQNRNARLCAHAGEVFDIVSCEVWLWASPIEKLTSHQSVGDAIEIAIITDLGNVHLCSAGT